MEPLSSDDPAEIGGYRLRARLGTGGMGRVYLASTPGGRRVALKVVRPELADDPDFRTRFRQEIAAAQRVRGLYTAELLSADPEATPPWLVTAYVPGPSLQRAVADSGPMPAETVILLVAGVAEALQAIHAVGVVHRDLKPSNVLLAPDGPRVIDFGIARAVEAASVTRSGIRVGSPQFMAPEQIRGSAATPAVDVFALGSVAAFALLGRVPFGEGNPAALMHRVLNEPPDLTGCEGPLRDLIGRCLAKDPAARPDPAQIIDSCRTLAEGNLGDFSESYWPTLSAPAQTGTAAEPGASPPPAKSSPPSAKSSPPSAKSSPPPAKSSPPAGPSPLPGQPLPSSRQPSAPPGQPSVANGQPSPAPSDPARAADAGIVPPEWARPRSSSGKTSRAPRAAFPSGSSNTGASNGPRTPGTSSGPRPAASPNGPRTSGTPGTSGTSTGPRTPAGTTGPRSRNGAPTGPRPYSGPGRPPIPPTLSNASKVMYAGAGLAIAGLLAGLGTLHSLRTTIEQQNPHMGSGDVSSTLGTAVFTIVVLGGIGALLWLWMARLTRRGERRARTLSTLFFALATLGAINLSSRGQATPLSGVFGVLEWIAGLIAIILLWSAPSRRYFDSLRPAPGVQPPRSPSLRERAEYQRTHPSQRDWPAQRR